MKKMAIAGLGAAMLGIALLTAPAAQAATAKNGVCESGEFCLYYNSDHGGSLVDLANSQKTYGTGAGCIEFVSTGSGKGQCVKNNTASVWNRESAVVTVFYKSDWAGSIDSIPSGAKVNLKSTLKNNNAGHVVGDATNDSLQFGLYQASGGTISAYFDGYLNTPGRHEGVDIAKGVGADVHSLTDGTVTRVTQGARGSGGLSTLAIYNSNLDKTIVYLHSDPLAFSVGANINRGQKIADEDWRGVSSSGAAHTHVEMRPGRQTAAAPSVNDYTLSNPIPTEFWMNRGYNACCS